MLACHVALLLGAPAPALTTPTGVTIAGKHAIDVGDDARPGKLRKLSSEDSWELGDHLENQDAKPKVPMMQTVRSPGCLAKPHTSPKKPAEERGRSPVRKVDKGWKDLQMKHKSPAKSVPVSRQFSGHWT